MVSLRLNKFLGWVDSLFLLPTDDSLWYQRISFGWAVESSYSAPFLDYEFLLNLEEKTSVHGDAW